MNLPDDIIIVILSYLSKRKLHSYALINLFPRWIIYQTMIHKFPRFRKEIIKGVVHNFYRRCFKCYSRLGMKFNIMLCYQCSPHLETNYNYPIICHNCTEHKLDRGEMKYSFCSICNYPTSHLGITPFS